MLKAAAWLAAPRRPRRPVLMVINGEERKALALLAPARKPSRSEANRTPFFKRLAKRSYELYLIHQDASLLSTQVFQDFISVACQISGSVDERKLVKGKERDVGEQIADASSTPAAQHLQQLHPHLQRGRTPDNTSAQSLIKPHGSLLL
ncbi:hypothetical protein E1301_Tti011546 [Triplophysa tibetana]|uniref:Uncharacterized protein n=1 Tax=Triplophysa tibetana TaxID=1572043 RepID=A0A5A9PHM6_9TELE|nr:hypothetical protein E1301_Tti011546 [Triplophysa tibetana]